MSRTVHVVENDTDARRSLGLLLHSSGYSPRPYLSGQDFIDDAPHLGNACVVMQTHMPDMDGPAVLECLGKSRVTSPVIMLARRGEVSAAVRAMKLGAFDVLETPCENARLLAALAAGFAQIDLFAPLMIKRLKAESIFARLSDRERAILCLLADGRSNKETAATLGLSSRTVEMNRKTLFAQLGVRTLVEAMRLAQTAAISLAPSDECGASPTQARRYVRRTV